MRIPRNSNPLTDMTAPRDDNQRRHGRLRCTQLACDLGEVLDMSASGLRVRCSRSSALKEGDVVGVTLQSAIGSLPVRVRVAWVKKTGFRKSEYGLTFDGLTPTQKSAVSAIAQMAVKRDTLRASA